MPEYDTEPAATIDIVRGRTDIGEYADGEEAGPYRRLLLTGDSFSDFLYPYLGYYFETSAKVHYYDLNEDIIEREAPDLVVLEVVERYLGNLRYFSLKEGVRRLTE